MTSVRSVKLDCTESIDHAKETLFQRLQNMVAVLLLEFTSMRQDSNHIFIDCLLQSSSGNIRVDGGRVDTEAVPLV